MNDCRSDDLGQIKGDVREMRARIVQLSMVLAVLITVEACSGCSRKGPEPTKIRADGKVENSTPVTSVADHLGSATNIRTDDAAILAAVRQNIESDPKITSKRIQVSFDHGTIKLKGRVTTDDELYAAGRDAQKIEGVQLVANYLSTEKYEGSPAQALPAGYDGVIDSILKSIRSDPKVTGKIEISFVPPDPRYKGLGAEGAGGNGAIRVAGSVEDNGQHVAAMNDARKMTDLPLLNGPTVLHDPLDPLRWSTQSPAAPPWNGPSPADKPIIPLCAGLTVVTAIAGPDGDYESIKTIESMDPKQVRLKYSAEVMQPWWETPHPRLKTTVTHRNVLTSDLESAHNYDYNFSDRAPETAPGATAIGTSAAMLRELKSKGESDLGLCGGDDDSPIRDRDGHVHALQVGCSVSDSRTIKRVGTEPVHVRVLLNGSPVDLPTVQAQGEWSSEQAWGHIETNEFFFLDDEHNPLTLKFRIGIGEVNALSPSQQESCNKARTKGGQFFSFAGICDLPDGGDKSTLSVVKITTECGVPGANSSGSPPNGVAALEQSLEKSDKVDIYSVYFSFNSDVLRDESQPTLKEIAEVLQRHRGWRLRIAGHTDGIGGDGKNLDLSKRRAAAVKDALVKKYGIAASRLETTGFGKLQPKDTNDTLEGRAHNRRVELMRIS